MALKLFLLICLLGFLEILAATYTTCDFDLLQENPSILQYLPEECQEINSQSDEYNLNLNESNDFKNFYDNLQDYENRLSQSYDPENGIPDKQWEVRSEVYSLVDLFVCNNETLVSDYFDCVHEKRQIMIQYIANKA